MDFDLAEGRAVLLRTPSVLHALLSDLPTAWTNADEGPDTWSPYVVVGHLIHGERTDWIPRASIILLQGVNRLFPPFDRFAQFRDGDSRPLSHLLDDFARLRRDSVATLDSWHLTPAQLALEGEHPVFGAVSLSQLLATWVAHDLGHIAQIVRVMARQYGSAVGPWRAYLSILAPSQNPEAA